MRWIPLFLLPVSCLFAQTPKPGQTVPLVVHGPDGKPIKTDKPPTMTLSMDDQSGGGPDLLSLPADKVVLTIGEEKITAGTLRSIIDTFPPNVREAARGQRRREFVEEYLIKVKLLADEARKQKLDESPAYKAQISYMGENLLAGSVYQNLMNSTPVDEKAARAWYEAHQTEWMRVKARHILIRMQGSPVPLQPGKKELTDEQALAKAQEIRKKLVAGGDFAELAKNESDDGGSGANGGDLGFFGKGQMVPPFEQAAFAQPVGQISEPVRSPFGYHIIKVEERQAKPFEEVRPEIEKRMRTELARKALEEKRQKATVTFDPDFFPPK